MVAWLAWIGVVTGGCYAAAAWADIDHTLSLSVVQIQGYPGTGRVALGSGVVVAPGRVATNCHVTQKSKVVVINKGAQQVKASAQRADVEKDLCLLDAPELQLPVARLGRSSSLKVGETLYLYGYPRATGIAFSQGSVQSLHAFKNSLVIETSADLTEGASGGGIFDDAGKLMGLATFFSAGHSGRNYAIPADWISGLSRKPRREIAPMDGLPFWQDLAHLPKFLKVPGQ